MPNPWLSAKTADLHTFLADYDPTQTPRYVSSARTTALYGATSNRDADARAAIASRLLDDGADPTVLTQSGASPVQALLGQSNPTSADAVVLRRLLDGGADINLPDATRKAPLAILYDNHSANDEISGPLYDVLFARPDLDLDAPGSRTHTVRERLAHGNPDYKPDLRRRVAAYEAAQGGAA